MWGSTRSGQRHEIVGRWQLLGDRFYAGALLGSSNHVAVVGDSEKAAAFRVAPQSHDHAAPPDMFGQNWRETLPMIAAAKEHCVGPRMPDGPGRWRSSRCGSEDRLRVGSRDQQWHRVTAIDAVRDVLPGTAGIVGSIKAVSGGRIEP